MPELEITGLREADAHTLLDSVTHAGLDRGIRARIVAETRGNPLALLELPRGLTATGLAGGLGLLNAETLPGRIEQSFLGRVERLPEQTRRLLLVAAAEPVGDPALCGVPPFGSASTRRRLSRAARTGCSRSTTG